MCAVLVAAACGDGDSGDGGLDVTSDTVSHATTQDILVFAPDAEGSWPVVVVMHGVGREGRGHGGVRDPLGA
jgi:poly(3-hydroxybutyrate) depolymerase